MKLPEDLLNSLHGVTGFEKDAFVKVHEEAETITSIRINNKKYSIFNVQYSNNNPVPWCDTGFYLEQRPSFTFDPLFHAGCYYVQEASSMFLEQPFKQLLDLSQPLKVLDLCAAPGGKSTHIQSLISKESLLVSNEVIKQRSYVLSDNIIKWGCQNVVVTNNDPKAFQKLPNYFDVMVVDAPCSGSGLFRKDEEAIGEWSLNNVQLCSQRQQRILADALPALKQDGLLIYSTCSYSTKEDEEIMDWLVEEMGMENIELEVGSWKLTDPGRGVVKSKSKSNAVGYRFYPDKIKGEGFFISCFRKTTEESSAKLRSSKAEYISQKEKAIMQEWVNDDGLSFLKFRDNIIALPQLLVADFLNLQSLLHIQYAGVAIGNVLKEKLVPHHALAQNTILKNDIPSTELCYEQAIKYLQRQDLTLTTETTGWQIVKYKNANLGWINALKNRVNNYYPKEIRILKAQNDSLFEK